MIAQLLAATRAGRRAFRGERPTGTWDAIVVAGCAVRPDGSPSPALRRRAELAAELFRAGVAPRVVLSGGVVTHPPSEAEVAARVVVASGVPESAVVLETAARNTRDNAVLTEALGVGRRVVVVTDEFHAARCHLWFSGAFDEVFVVGCRSPRRWRHVPWEAVSVLYQVRRAARGAPRASP